MLFLHLLKSTLFSLSIHSKTNCVLIWRLSTNKTVIIFDFYTIFYWVVKDEINLFIINQIFRIFFIFILLIIRLNIFLQQRWPNLDDYELFVGVSSLFSVVFAALTSSISFLIWACFTSVMTPHKYRVINKPCIRKCMAFLRQI